MIDAVADRQFVGRFRGAQGIAVRIKGGFLELMHRINTTLGVACMKLSNQYSSHLICNLGKKEPRIHVRSVDRRCSGEFCRRQKKLTSMTLASLDFLVDRRIQAV